MKRWQGGQRTLDEIATLTLSLNDEPADTPPLADAAPPPALTRRPPTLTRRWRRVLALLGVLLLHGFGALTWVVSLGFSSDAGTDRQLNEALKIGAATWLVAALLIALLCLSGRLILSLFVPGVWWLPSFLLAITVAYGWGNMEPTNPYVYATATFKESADCLDYWRGNDGWRLGGDNISYCFPTQTTAKRLALIACFNKYERNHPDHKDWPDDNMRGCTWDGLAEVPVQNVAKLAFGKVVAVPAVPRAGKPFVLNVPVSRSDSVAKRTHTEWDIDNPVLGVAVTINGENVAIESVEGCSECRVPGDPQAEEWFDEGEIRVKFTVPSTAEGKRLTIKMTAAVQDDTPTATKVVAFTVNP